MKSRLVQLFTLFFVRTIINLLNKGDIFMAF